MFNIIFFNNISILTAQKCSDINYNINHFIFIQHLENKITSRLEQMAVTQKEEFARLKRETREGFSTVHESITNMKTVMEGKRKLLEDQLRKEISQIRKMVVLV